MAGQQANNDPTRSIGERRLTSDEPPFDKAATDHALDEPATFSSVVCSGLDPVAIGAGSIAASTDRVPRLLANKQRVAADARLPF
ncbi:hypothetical protein [Burkholderia sp. SRS-W-2-2016]|uniref:hypothetical protein n=1 Tax=Burkholderia sp. SRS-W-2-2016 TaxID=1926878 RepID=UPI00117D7EB7|nr:hypothetical protein [Burkholderia sp. SRS-W-2-2016]